MDSAAGHARGIVDASILAEGIKLERELNAANERIQRLEEALEGSWSIIANVSDGDWTRQKPYWQDYVFRWRDNYFNPIMKELSECKAKDSQ
jgi:hypothetical protein